MKRKDADRLALLSLEQSQADLLASPQRRTLLRVLAQYDRPQALADLARDVAGCEHDTSRTDTPHDAIERVHLKLHHIHLPKLDDAGLVQYDLCSKTAVLTTRGERLVADLDSRSSALAEKL